MQTHTSDLARSLRKALQKDSALSVLTNGKCCRIAAIIFSGRSNNMVDC